MPLKDQLRTAVRPIRRRASRVDLRHHSRIRPARGLVDQAVYEHGLRHDEPTYQDAVDRARKDNRHTGAFVWLGLHEPTEAEFAEVAEHFGLHHLAVEDAADQHQRPKVESYDDTLFTVFKTVRHLAHGPRTATSAIVETGKIMVFVGPYFVITIRHGAHTSLHRLRASLEARPEVLTQGPAAVLHAVADHVVDGYVEAARTLQDDLDQIENDVFSPKDRRSTDVESIYQMKRELLEFKRAVGPLLDPMRQLAAAPPPPLPRSYAAYFRDVTDRLAQVGEQVQGYDELLTSVLQANLAQVSVAQNEDMRRISAWVAILAVPTMICAIYGMNFDTMPELRWSFGYPVVLSVTVVACTVLHRMFRRNGWL